MTSHPREVRPGPWCTEWSHAFGGTAWPRGSSEMNRENGQSWTVAFCAGAAAMRELEGVSLTLCVMGNSIQLQGSYKRDSSPFFLEFPFLLCVLLPAQCSLRHRDVPCVRTPMRGRTNKES